MSGAERIDQLHERLRAGKISRQEFDRARRRILEGEDDPQISPQERITPRTRSSSDAATFRSELPFMANLIFLYCFVGGPIIWVLELLVVSAETTASDTSETAIDGLWMLVNLAVLGLMVYGGWQLRNLRPAARPILLTGFWIKLGAFILFFVLSVAVDIAHANPANVKGPNAGFTAADVLALFGFTVMVCDLACVITGLIWVSGAPAAALLRRPSARRPSQQDSCEDGDDGDSQGIGSRPSERSREQVNDDQKSGKKNPQSLGLVYRFIFAAVILVSMIRFVIHLINTSHR
jgi:hypothetical protein